MKWAEDAWNREISDKAIYVHLHQSKLLSPSPSLIFAGTSLSLLLDTIDTSGSSFFDIVFFFDIETN